MRLFSLPGLYNWYFRSKATDILSHWGEWISISGNSIRMIWQQAGSAEDFALELLENTWIKLLSVNKIRSWSHTRFSAGGPLYQNVTIGGQTVDGKDAVNDLSFLILDSVGRMKLTQPNLSVRFHKNIDPAFS